MTGHGARLPRQSKGFQMMAETDPRPEMTVPNLPSSEGRRGRTTDGWRLRLVLTGIALFLLGGALLAFSEHLVGTTVGMAGLLLLAGAAWARSDVGQP